MSRHIITLLMICCLTAYAANDDIQLQPDHPDRYVVVKGDTLWGISGKFLKDPWLWPKVWQMNRNEIKNPHLIYPGDVVALDMSTGKPMLRLLHETVSMQPGTRIEPLEKEAIPTIAPNIIQPFLEQPLVIENNELKNSPMIVSGPDNRVIMSPGTKIYVTKIEDGQGLYWHVYREGKPLLDPDTSEQLGTEANYLGDAKVRRYGAPATAEVVKSKEEILVKDLLVPVEDNIMSSFVPHAPETQIEGKVISVYGGLAETGRNSVITINRGKNDGVEVGQVFAVARKGGYVKNPIAPPEPEGWWEKTKAAVLGAAKTEPKKRAIDYGMLKKETNEEREARLAKDAKDPTLIKLPNERVGLVMVFRVFNKVAYGLVVQASEPVNIGDVVENP